MLWNATKLPRNDKLISLQKNMLATCSRRWRHTNFIGSTDPPRYTHTCICVCVCLLFASPILLFAILVFSISDFQLCAVCVMFMAESGPLPLSLCGLSSVIICAIAVHGNQHNNDKSLVFHFNFMERDVCSSYKG